VGLGPDAFVHLPRIGLLGQSEKGCSGFYSVLISLSDFELQMDCGFFDVLLKMASFVFQSLVYLAILGLCSVHEPLLSRISLVKGNDYLGDLCSFLDASAQLQCCDLVSDLCLVVDCRAFV